MEGARKAAQAFGNEYLGPEHMALGMLARPNSAAVRILESLAIAPDVLRGEIERTMVRSSKQLTLGQLPFTKSAKRVLEVALTESRELGHTVFGTGHLLLGLVVAAESIPGRLLAARSLDVLSVHAALESNPSKGDDAPRPSIDTTGWRKEALMRAVLILRAAQHERLAGEVEHVENELA